jgi:hypothetical protein
MTTPILNRRADPGRSHIETGIYVRAQLDGKWVSGDIGQLDKASLLAGYDSRGGDNPWAENTGPLHADKH